MSPWTPTTISAERSTCCLVIVRVASLLRPIDYIRQYRGICPDRRYKHWMRIDYNSSVFAMLMLLSSCSSGLLVH